MKKLIAYLSCFFLIVAMGCRTKAVYVSQDGKYEAIGACQGIDDQTQQLIRSILSEKNISVEFWGQLLDGIYVPIGKGPEAKQLLKKDKRLKGRWIKYY